MQCPKCGTEITRDDVMEDGSIRCPGCGAIYRRRAANESQQTEATAEQQQRRRVSHVAEPSPEIKRPDSRGEREKSSAEKEYKVPNGVSLLLRICAYAIYVGALLLGIMAENNTSATIFRYIRSFSTISMVSIWITGFVYGTIALSVSEIIQLLHEINEKISDKS